LGFGYHYYDYEDAPEGVELIDIRIILLIFPICILAFTRKSIDKLCDYARTVSMILSIYA
jgi:hypothetical protein